MFLFFKHPFKSSYSCCYLGLGFKFTTDIPWPSLSRQSNTETLEFATGIPNHSSQSPEVMSKETGDESQEEKNSTSDNSVVKKFSEADHENVPESKSVAEVNISNGFLNHGEWPEEEAAAFSAKEENESVRILQEKLSAALINVSLKDELIQQHTKVAEEAIAGWEKAEDEVASLKQQLDTTSQENTTLEAQLAHLDEALKECVRQLRMEKEEHELKICEALAEYEASKLKLENKIVELQTQAEACSARPPVLADTGILLKLEVLERENQKLNNKLMSQSEELEIRTIERDLSTKAAEAASKQSLEGIKMVAKLESECRKLKALSQKSPLVNKGQLKKSPSTSSYSIDSVTNSETSEPAGSDSWATALMAELDQFKNDRSLGRSLQSSSTRIDPMDDFLEMERLAAMPENGHSHEDHHAKSESPKQPSVSVESRLREELKVIMCRAAELEEKVKKLEAEKAELEMDSAQTQLSLENSQVEVIESKIKLEELEAELQEANELKMEFESYANDLKLEAKAMMSKIELLQEEIDRQRVSSEKLSARCQELEYDLDGKNKELELESELEEKERALAESQKRLDELQIQVKVAVMNLEKQSLASRIELDEKEKELSESQKRLEVLQIQLKESEMKLEKQNVEYNSELEVKEMALSQIQVHLVELQTQNKEAAVKLEKLKTDLDEANESNECLSSELASSKEEVGAMSVQIESLLTQIDKEKVISAELSAKCEELQKEVKQMEQQLERHESICIEQKINQEDVASAAGKLEECQKTIASLGNQLKSLATLEDFFMDTASIPKFSGSAPLIPNGGLSEMWKLHPNNQKKCDGHLQDPQQGIHTFSKYVDKDMIESTSNNMFNYSGPSGIGHEKLFPMRRS
ncbi:hypothetical protein V2J09_008715 [Rumex salicifolius]